MSKILRKELKMTRDFDSPEQEAIIAIARTQDRLQIAFVRLFRAFGMTPVQYNILRILRGAKQPLASLEVADRLIATVPGITGLIDRLEKQSLVCRDRAKEDRRVVHISLTGRGQEILESLEGPVNELHRKLLGHMTSEELHSLVGLLDKARAGEASKA